MKIQTLVSGSIIIVFLLMHLDLNAQKNTFVDPRDSLIYKTVKIGNQTWMAENLKYFDKKLYVFAYNQDTNNYHNYGGLYDWESALKACPSGWHLPSYLELDTLLTVMGKDKAVAYNYLIKGGNSGFDALLGGQLTRSDHGYYSGIERIGFYWSSTNNNSEYYAKCIMFNKKMGKVFFNRLYQAEILSVRCIKD